MQSLEVADDEPEPPVPAGLGTLDAPLTAVGEFLCIDRDLIAAAAAGLPSTSAAEPSAAQLRTWVTQLPTREKDTILTDLITGNDTHLRPRPLRRHRDAIHTDAAGTTTQRTAGELLTMAAHLRTERERRGANSANVSGSAGSSPPPGNGTSTNSQ